MEKIDECTDEQFQEANHLAELLKENIVFWRSEIKPSSLLVS
jgi:hypothetical protein